MKDLIFIPGGDAQPTVSQLGGKAGNLAILTAKGMPVPSWMALTTAYFEEFMGESLPSMDRLLGRPMKQGDLAGLSKKLINMIEGRRFSKKLKELMESSLRDLFGSMEQRYFSIRSSAVDEDSRSHSFAGQMESFLYVPFDRGFYEIVRKCFISAYAERVLSYRFHARLPLKGVRPAVIVQEMIFGDVSGVLFTGNPLNNNTDEILINATYGIGEGIVSGELDTDLWVVNEKNEIVSKKIAEKLEMIIFDEVNRRGTKKVSVETARIVAECMSEETVKLLAARGREIERIFGFIPQDIEWCFREGELFILQSRPVTILSHVNKSEYRTIFDNSNIIESFSGVTSPLTFSFASTVYDTVYRQFFNIMGTPQKQIDSMAEVFRNMLAYINGRVYYNLNSWYTCLQLLPGYNFNRKFMENMMGVKSSANIEMEEKLSAARRFFVELPKLLGGVARILFSFLLLKKKRTKFIENFNRVTVPYLDEKFENYNNRELLNLYQHFVENILKDWKAPIINDFYTMIFYGLLSGMIKKINLPDNANLQNNLLSGEGDMESTKPTRDIITMANWIREQKALIDLFAREREDRLEKLILHGEDEALGDVRGLIKEYLSRWGFRCMNELKLEESSLKENPRFLFTTLKNYLRKEAIDLGMMERREREIRAEAEKILYRHVKGFRGLLMRMILRNARSAIKNREELRFMRTKIFGIIRNMFNAMGRNFCRDGLIRDASDVFYMHVHELFEFVEGRSLNTGIIRDIIKLRRREFEAHKTLETPERMYFFGDIYRNNYVEILTDEMTENGEETESNNTFRGVPCSPGEVEGLVKIVLMPEDADLNGEILVTKRTDPGWVPLFPSVSGIVIERGSVLSHSAVVAREMGIPTVVGLRGITEKLKNNDKIRINGTTGLVEKIV